MPPEAQAVGHLLDADQHRRVLLYDLLSLR